MRPKYQITIAPTPHSQAAANLSWSTLASEGNLSSMQHFIKRVMSMRPNVDWSDRWMVTLYMLDESHNDLVLIREEHLSTLARVEPPQTA